MALFGRGLSELTVVSNLQTLSCRMNPCRRETHQPDRQK